MDLPTRDNYRLLTRAKRIKQATTSAHDRIDKTIMDYNPFADIHRYCSFLQMQHSFHLGIEKIYSDVAKSLAFPSFECSSRLGCIEADLADLGERPHRLEVVSEHAAVAPRDLPTALGWLYVAEGSHLGAAFLLKEVAKLGLSEMAGARHLAAPVGGRGLHWRNFTTALDSADLTDAAEALVILGAQSAFAHVRFLATHHFDGH